MASGRRWTREELLIVLNIYEKLPFGLFDQRQAVIQQLAARLDRTASSVAMKLSNLASLDPVLHARGRKGLSGASELDRATWDDFHTDREKLAPESEERLRELFHTGTEDELDVVKDLGIQVRKAGPATIKPPTGATSARASVMLRRGQQYFRQIVLNAYGGKCCVTGLPVRELLVASHIQPWNNSIEARLDQRNGLCLNRLHDSAFDQGLMTLDEDLRIVVSKSLRSAYSSSAAATQFQAYEGVRITSPEGDLAPAPQFLAHHRSNVFQG